MERKDMFFIAMIMLGIAALIAITRRPRDGEVFASVTVPNATEEVGMSLSPECNPPDASPFKGRYAIPPSLMGLNPSTTTGAIEGVAPLSTKDYH